MSKKVVFFGHSLENPPEGLRDGIPLYLHYLLTGCRSHFGESNLFACFRQDKLEQSSIKKLSANPQIAIESAKPSSLILMIRTYFSSLPDPVVPVNYFNRLVEISDLEVDEQIRLIEYHNLFKEMRSTHVVNFNSISQLVNLLREYILTGPEDATLLSVASSRLIIEIFRTETAGSGDRATVLKDYVKHFVIDLIENYHGIFLTSFEPPKVNGVPMRILKVRDGFKYEDNLEMGSSLPALVYDIFKSLQNVRGNDIILTGKSKDPNMENLKDLLENLCEPILTFELYEKLEKIDAFDVEYVHKDLLNTFLVELPTQNRELLGLLFNFLKKNFGNNIPSAFADPLSRFLIRPRDVWKVKPYSFEKVMKCILVFKEQLLESFPEFIVHEVPADNDVKSHERKFDENEVEKIRLKIQELFDKSKLENYDVEVFQSFLTNRIDNTFLRFLCQATTNNVAQDRLSRALFILFDGVKEGAFEWLLEEEIRKTRMCHTLFRVNSFATKIFTHSSNHYGKQYLTRILAPPFEALDRDHPERYEVDPMKVRTKRELHRNQIDLAFITSVYLSFFVHTSSQVPTWIRVAVSTVKKRVAEYFNEEFGTISIGAFVVLRFIVPTLIMPEEMKIMGSLTPELRRALVLVSKSIQSIANDIQFGQKAYFMRYLNTFLLSKYQQKMRTFLKEVAIEKDSLSASHKSNFSVQTKLASTRSIFDYAKDVRLELDQLLRGVSRSDLSVLNESDSVYDCVVKLNSLEELIQPPEGIGGDWEVKFSNVMKDDFQSGKTKWTSSMVAVLGLYNKGKTHILNRLTSTELQSGIVVHTEGLSFKVIKNQHVNHVLLDTAGKYAPVEIESTDSNKLDLKKGSELFLEELVFELADFMIVVVNDLTSLDQEYINKLILKLRNNSEEKIQLLFVVHNFKNTRDEKQLRQLWFEQVTNIYKGGEIVEEMVEVVDHKTGNVSLREIEWFNTGITRHIYLADENSAVGRKINDSSIQLLKNWLSSNFVPVSRNISPVDHIVSKMNMLLPKYILRAVDLEYSRENSRVRMKPSEEVSMCKLIPPMTLGSAVYFPKNNFIVKKDIVTSEEGIEFFLDIPGIPERPRIQRVGFNKIRVSGERQNPYEKSEFLMKERKFGKFTTAFAIPVGYDIDRLEYDHVNGVLRIHLPAIEEEEEL